ncbi:MAG TPA: allantoate amidohydrolase [Ktedonobacterales bacterium]
MSPVSSSSYADAARLVLERCDQLGSYSEEPDRRTRRYGTEAMRQVNEAVVGWMLAAGMQPRQYAIGNLVARYEAATPDAKSLVLGSHLDTVRDAGKYDGPLGVLVALACVERLAARGQRLPFAVELVAFADEEGLRFHTAYLGSSAFTGALPREALDQTDLDGVTLREAIQSFGGDPDALGTSAHQRDELLGYCEVHIEQGPLLEARGLPVGVVSAIQGQTRVAISMTGVAGHAGTVPMSLRHDALAAAAEYVVAVERTAQNTLELVATVGQLLVEPGASNVIPGHVAFSLDLRHPDDQVREKALTALRAEAQTISERRGVSVAWQTVSAQPSLRCSPQLIQLQTDAITAAGYPALMVASGAGHDGVVMSALTDIAMFFVRCKGGVSHSPAESVAQEDVAVAIEALERFIVLLADRGDAS